MLYIVATPIGNLEDITLRALRILKEADLILVEDTRKTGLFLKRLNIPKKALLSFYEHNETERMPRIIEYLKQGKNIALVTSSGTPLISDPGFKLVKKCIEERIPFTCIPGASSVINALVLSGAPTDSFLFLGFLPKKEGRRRKRIQEVENLAHTLVFFESPQRLRRTLAELRQVLGERNCCVCREITKFYEETIRGGLSEIIDNISERNIKGECTIVLEGHK